MIPRAASATGVTIVATVSGVTVTGYFFETCATAVFAGTTSLRAIALAVDASTSGGGVAVKAALARIGTSGLAAVALELADVTTGGAP